MQMHFLWQRGVYAPHTGIYELPGLALVKFSGTIQTFGEIWQLLNFTSGSKGAPQG
jgi:hypothetical protein